MQPRRRIAAVVTIAVLLIPAVASAYERSTVESNPTIPLFWRYRRQRVYIAAGTSNDLSAERVQALVLRSIDTWNAAAGGCSDFLIEDAGPAIGLETNLFTGDHDGENRIVWREDEWPDHVPPQTLALTTLVYRRSTGEIVDADIDMNGVDHTWTDSVENPRTDAQNTMTHELGHLLGLAHVLDPAATMFGESGLGDLEKRTLEQDDIDGLCFVYPRGRLTPEAPVLPPAFLTTGCTVRIAQRSPIGALAITALALLLARRRRAARRSMTPVG